MNTLWWILVAVVYIVGYLITVASVGYGHQKASKDKAERTVLISLFWPVGIVLVFVFIIPVLIYYMGQAAAGRDLNQKEKK